MQRLRTRLRAGATAFPPATFALNFLTGALDSGVTFSRGSNATLVDSTGKITYAPANLLLQSQTFDNVAWIKGNTTVTANAAVAPDGTSTADKLVENTANSTHSVTQTVVVVPSSSYMFTAYLKAGEETTATLALSVSPFPRVKFNLATGVIVSSQGGGTGTISDAGNGWYRCSLLFTPSGTDGNMLIAIRDIDNNFTGDGTSGIFIWGAQLEPVTYQTAPSTYVATTTAAYYGPRFDYDPVTLAAKGLLIEEQRTNLLTYSEQFDNGIWVKFDASVGANTTVAPNGTTTADTLTENTANTSHYLSIVPSTSAGSHTLSVFYKIPSARKLALYHSNTNTGRQFDASGNQSAGLFVAPAGGATVTSFGNGWYRATITVTTTAAVQEFRLWMVRASDDAISYTGDGTSGIFLYGAQLEAGAFATSYIPTVASQVTRSADVATMTGTNFSSWYNATEGALLAEVLIASKSGSYGIYAADDGTTNNAFPSFYGGTALANARVGGAGVFSGQSAALSATPAVLKIGFAYAASNYAASFNGAAPTTQASGAIPTGLNRLQLGAYNSVALNGHIRQIAYYNTRLPNATLQALTA